MPRKFSVCAEPLSKRTSHVFPCRVNKYRGAATEDAWVGDTTSPLFAAATLAFNRALLIEVSILFRNQTRNSRKTPAAISDLGIVAGTSSLTAHSGIRCSSSGIAMFSGPEHAYWTQK